MRRARGACGAAAAAAALGFVVLAPWQAGSADGAAGGSGLEVLARAALGWAAGANALACGLLALLAPAWAGPAASPAGPSRLPAFRGFALLLLAAALLAGALRWPLAHSSLWPDEAWAVENTISGIEKIVRADPDRLRVRTVSWTEAFFDYARPTNHVLYSVAARASNEAWRAAAGREAPAFDAFAVRLPAWLAAVATVPLLGLLLRDWGFPRAGAAAAFLLAVHPWHAVHGAEARGYAFVALFAATACLALTRALRGGSWAAWLGFAASLWLLVWSHLFAGFLALALGAAALAGAAAADAASGARRAQLARAALSGLVAGMLVAQSMAPNLVQMAGWRGQFVAREETQLSLAALGHLWSYAATGLEARLQGDPPERPPGVYPSLAAWAGDSPWVYPVVVGLLPLLAALGGLRVLARGGAPRAVALGLAASVPLALAANQLLGGQWYARFVFWSVLAVTGFAALGAETALERLPLPTPRARRRAVAAGLGLAVLAYQALVWPQTRLLLTRPQLPSREAVALARAEGGDEALLAVLGLSGGNMHFVLYDPWLREFETAPELAALAREARAEDRPLVVLYAYAYKNRDVRPGPFRWLDDPTLFREVGVLHAVYDERMVRVLRWTGAPLEPGGGGGAPAADRGARG